MYYIALYFLVGAIVAVWTAISQSRIEPDPDEPKRPGFATIGAYALIALAWPISIVAFVYTLFAGLVAGEGPGGE
jgi:hypothetical protein